MGPSPVGDGKSVTAGKSPGVSNSFNGAVACWRRKDWHLRLDSCPSGCFNGAVACWRRKDVQRWQFADSQIASMGPSPVGDGKPALRRSLRPARQPASMGPSPVGDGKNTTMAQSRSISQPLQWGRRLLATESRVESSDEGTLFEASMGPSPVGDGKQRDRHGHGVELSASMGPSPVGDGKAAEQSPPR